MPPSGKMSKMAVFAMSCMALGTATENVQPAARSASAMDVINIVAAINDPFQQAGRIEHDGHGRILHDIWLRGDGSRRGDGGHKGDSGRRGNGGRGFGFWTPITPSRAPSPAAAHLWPSATHTPVSPGVWSPTTPKPDAPPTSSHRWSPTAPSPTPRSPPAYSPERSSSPPSAVSSPTAARMWSPSTPTPASSPTSSRDRSTAAPSPKPASAPMQGYGNHDDDQSGNGRDITSSGSSSSSSSTSTTFPCMAEAEACVADAQSGGCWECLQELSAGDILTCGMMDGVTCSDVTDYFCCTFGDFCGGNEPLGSYIGCYLEDLGCGVEGGICDNEVDSGSRIDMGPEMCSAELDACVEDGACADCMGAAAMVGDTCDSSGAFDCEGKADYFCCVAGNMDGCSDNSLFLDYANCAMELESCPLDDIACPSGGGGGNDDDVDLCPAELSDCQADETCSACYDGAVQDETCSPGNAIDCAGFANYFCCVAGDACSENALLLGWLNCGLEIISPEECTLTDLCDHTGNDDHGISPVTSDDDGGDSSSDDSSSSTEDGEACPAELFDCLADEACAACFEGATLDGSCDTSTSDCSGIADYYCCVAGESCSDNVLAVAYINCLVDVELDEPCVLTDVCHHARGNDDGTTDDDAAGDDNPANRGGGGSDDDGDICIPEMIKCQADETCAACFAEANLDGTCNPSTATDCAGAVDFYCCVAGDACSDNPELLDWLNCGLKEFFPEESCMVADLCPVFSTEAPPSLPSGTGTGSSDDDSSPTSSSTSSPSGGGEHGGAGEANACFVREMACVADETCESCMAGARLDGSCNRDVADCAGVAGFYCCVAGEDCSDNDLLLDYVNCGIELESCTLTDLCNYSDESGDDDSAASREIGGSDDGSGEGEMEEVSTEAPSFSSGEAGSGIMTFSPTSSPTSAPTDSANLRGGGGGEGGPDACDFQQMACMWDDTCAACMTGARLDGSCVSDAGDCAGVSDYFCCVAGESCSDNALLLDFINCGIELDSCTLTDLCD